TAAVCLGFIQGDFKNLLGNKENQAATELWEESDFAGVSEASPLAGDDPRVRDFKVSGSVGSGGSGSHGGLQGRVHSFRFLSHYSGIPDKFFIKLRSLKGIDVQCSEGKMQAPSLRLTGTSDTESKWQAVRHSFETDIDKPEEPQSGPKRLDIKLGGIPEAVLRRFSPSFGTVTAPIDVYLYRYQIIGRVPLKKGSRCTKESEYVEVTGLRLKPSACIVSVEIQNANKNYFSTHRLRNETIIALHNKKRNETVLQDTMGRENYRYEDLPGQGLAKIFQDFTFSLEGNRDPFVKTLDRDWLEGAELVYLQAEIVGKTTRPFHMKRLIIPAEPGFSAGGKTDRLPLTRITLPENADAAQAKAYLRQVFIASAEKRRRSTDDIEIDMLAEVGPRHIELLGKMGVLYDMEFYAMQAIQRIIEPGSKQQILNILEYYDESDLDGLLAIVCREGWGEAIKPMLIEKLEAGEGLSMLHSWMEMGCVPLTRAEYPVLKRALPGIIRSFNRGSMYRDLYGWMHSLPDFDVP
ncbi:MAG: hypothetical protein GY765_23080, partial [bacterium]|nr:hypothetical protein [bacterium]